MEMEVPIKKPQLIQLKPTVANLPKVKVLKTKFPKAAVSQAAAKKRFAAYKARQKLPTVKNVKVALKPVAITKSNLTSFIAVREADQALAAIDKHFKKDLSGVINLSHSVMTTLAYIKMRDEFKTRLKKARTQNAKLKVKQEWGEILNSAITLSKAAGGPSLTPAKLDDMARTLTRNKKAYAEAISMMKSAKPISHVNLSATTKFSALVIPHAILDAAANTGVIDAPSNICDTPLEGTYTQHYSNSLSLDVRFRYWCPSWRHPTRMCTGTVTLAAVGFNIGLNVGYRVSCCGAAIWGNGYVNACGTVMGITACAGCSATIVGVGGIARTPLSRGRCDFGLGANASITCKVGSITVFYISYTFGFALRGPCPPSPLPC